MTTPDFPMPYAVRWHLFSRYWYYIGSEHRQEDKESRPRRHHLPEGAYQIMVSTIAGRGARIDVSGYNTESVFTYTLIPAGEEGVLRTGMATIYIPVGGGYIECMPRDPSGGDKPEDALQTPLVMQVFPLESYKP